MEHMTANETLLFTSTSGTTGDALIASSFHRVFRLANAYYDDASECLAIATAVFRHVDGEAEPTAETVVHRALELIFDRVLDADLMPGLSQQAVFCWMLKDSSPLNYAEIGYIFAIGRGTVRDHIAAVRNRLLDGASA